MKRIAPFACLLLMMSCSWVKDETAECPYGFWLRLHYTYNMLDVEAAPKYVTDAYVYVYDTEGHFVRRIYASRAELAAQNYMVRVEDLPEGDYQFVVWSGLEQGDYAVSGDTGTLDGFRLALAGGNGECATDLSDLFYGYLPTVHYDDAYATYDIDLVKNTNQLACLIVSVDHTERLSPDDFSMKVVAANGTLDAFNRPATDVKTVYRPFLADEATFDDADYGQLHGVRFSLKTLRLLSDQDCRIILERKQTNDVVFNISIPEYVGMIGSLYTAIGKPVSVQEYLDRQDFYTIVFYLSGDLSQLMQLKVNNWQLRASNHLKL